jgi:hypothetical protein
VSWSTWSKYDAARTDDGDQRAALERLLDHARGDTHQSRRVADFHSYPNTLGYGPLFPGRRARMAPRTHHDAALDSGTLSRHDASAALPDQTARDD